MCKMFSALLRSNFMHSKYFVKLSRREFQQEGCILAYCFIKRSKSGWIMPLLKSSLASRSGND